MTLRSGLTLMAVPIAILAAALPLPSAAGAARRAISSWVARTGTSDGDTVASGPVTDSARVFLVPPAPRPEYLTRVAEPTFGTLLMRISADSGAALRTLPGTWGSDARHVYSKQQPWNSDGTLLSIQNRGGSPSPLLLDGNTYLPMLGPCAASEVFDYRWHPSPLHPHEQINVDRGGTELMWFDVTTCTKTRSWQLPLVVDYGIGSSEGNPSNDGRFVALGNDSAMFVVDMDPQPPFAPYPHLRIGPACTFAPCSLGTEPCVIGYLSISPSGRYVQVKYNAAGDSVTDIHRIYEVDSTTLELRPHAMAEGSLRCGSFAARPNGWIFPLKHADLALDPFDHDEDVLVGGRACPGSDLGRVVKVRLRDGQVTALTDPNHEAIVSHVSARNLERPGWVYVSYYRDEGTRFDDEIVAVKLDGSGSVERYAHKHSLTSDCYRCESHAVPSRDGRRILFASNWAADCDGGCGTPNEIKAYVVWSPVAADTQLAPSDPPGFRIESVRPNPVSRTLDMTYSVDDWGSTQVDLVDIAGRRIVRRSLGAPGPGRHDFSLGELNAPSGIYWMRLSQSGRAVVVKVAIVR